MMLTLALVATLGTAAATPIPEADYTLQLPEYNLQIRDYSFPSGLRILFQEERSQPIVSITTVVNHGSGSDFPGNEGIAHLVEHMNFRARHGELPKNMDFIKQIGGSFNAFTTVDKTAYMTIAPRDALVPLLRLEALRIGGHTIENVTKADLDTEREVVRNELRQNFENAIGDAFSSLAVQLYPEGHPYHFTTIGTHEGLDNSDLEAVQRFTDAFYRPSEATIVVAGDFDLDETGEFINQVFGDMPELLVDPDHPDAELELVEPTPHISGDPPPVPDPVDPGPRTVEGLVDNTTVVVGWTMPGAYRGDDMNMQVAVNLVQTAILSHLYADWNPLTDDPIENIGCYVEPRVNASMAACFAEPVNGMSPEKTIEEIGDALYQVWEPIDTNSAYGLMIKNYQDWSYSNSKASMMSSVLASADEVSSLYGRATELAMHVHYTGSPTYFHDMFNQTIPSADLEASRQMARKYLNRDRMVSVIVNPLSEEEKARRHAAVATGAEKHTYHATQAATEFESAFNLEDLSPEAIERVVVVPDRESIHTFTLENGLDVAIMDYGDAPLARVGLFYYGTSDLSVPPGLDAFAESLVRRGDHIEPNEQLTQVAGRYWEQNTAGVGRSLMVEGAAGNVDALLRRLRQESQQLGWRPANKRTTIRQARRSMVSDGSDAATWADRLSWAALAPEHPLGMWYDASFYEGQADWDMDMVKAWIERKYQPANATLVMVGNLDPATTEAQVRRMFGDWTAPEGVEEPPPRVYPEFTVQPERTVLVFNKPEANQFEINLTCQAAAVPAERVAEFQILGDVMSELAWRTLREREGVTYGAYAYTRWRPGGVGTIHGWSLVQADAAGYATKAFLDIFERASQGDFDDASMAHAKWSRARKYVLGHQSGSQMLDRLMGIRAQGLDFDVFETYPHDLANVTTEGFPELMAPCVGHEVVTLVGPAEFAESLSEFGVEYEVVDWEELRVAQMNKKERKKYLKAKEREAREEAEAEAEED